MLAPWLDPADEQSAQTLVAQAWLLATSRYEDRRDGARAVELARQACEITEWRAFGCLETLAAACAACGDFESADKHQTRAVELAAADKEGRRAAFKRPALFRERRPLHTVR